MPFLGSRRFKGDAVEARIGGDQSLEPGPELRLPLTGEPVWLLADQVAVPLEAAPGATEILERAGGLAIDVIAGSSQSRTAAAGAQPEGRGPMQGDHSLHLEADG
jgi:hypothetical protein